MALNWDLLSDLFDEQSEVTDALIGFLAESSEASELNLNTLLSSKPEICHSQEYTGCNINLIPNQKPETRLSLEDTEFNVDSLLNPQSEMCLAEEDIGFDMPSLLSLEPEINLLAKTEPDKLPAINCSVCSAPRNLPLDEAWYNANAEFAPALLSNYNLSCNNLSGSMPTNNPSNASLHHDSYNKHAEIAPAPLTKHHKSSSNLFGTEAFNNPANSVHQGPRFTVGSSNEVHRRAVPTLQHASLHHDSYNKHAEIAPAPLTKHHKSSSNLFGTEAFNNPANSVHQSPRFTVGSSNKVHRRAVPALQHVSARNIAARQRSRKISEKTKELGKLIPGGTHLMTADMLLASIRQGMFHQWRRSICKFCSDQPLCKRYWLRRRSVWYQ